LLLHDHRLRCAVPDLVVDEQAVLRHVHQPRRGVQQSNQFDRGKPHSRQVESQGLLEALHRAEREQWPSADQFEAQFKGEKAKLFWRVGISGEEEKSETFKLIELLEPAPSIGVHSHTQQTLNVSFLSVPSRPDRSRHSVHSSPSTRYRSPGARQDV
jgi:hypothetical protein